MTRNSIQFCKDIGTNRPDIISRIERLLYRLLIQISLGEIDSTQALHNIVNSVPWDDVNKVDGELAHYFAAG